MPDNGNTGSADVPQGTASGERTPDFQAKYNGLQSAFQKRTNEWAAKETAWAEEREQLAAAVARGAEYEAREAAERVEAEELAKYEALRKRFETEPPAPMNPNASNFHAQTGWDDRYPRKGADTEPKSTGWPT